MLKHDKILLFDFETTGLDARFEEIIEVGAVLLKRVDGQYKVTDELSLLVQPHKRLPDKIVEITHITDEMLLREGVTQEEAFQRFFEMYEDEHTLLIAYNILFDLSFMIEWMKKYHNRHFILKK
jgi:DNA polymerase III alpha subunit (gram-positive type)